VRRAQAIRAIEKMHGSRVITMIHRQEKRSLFGFSVARHIESSKFLQNNPGHSSLLAIYGGINLIWLNT
jgi:hypothetical protein